MTGTIYSGTYVNGIVLDDPATQLPATVTGSVSNTDGDAIYGKPGARWTVVNQGTIQSTGTTGYGIDLAARGAVENGDSGATAALISGYGGVLIHGTLATVANYATIDGTGSKRNGVELRNGGRVINGGTGATAALISGGRNAVAIRNAAGTVRNFGTLASTGTANAVDLFAGGRVTNGSTVSTGALIGGVYISGAAGTVANFGTIEGGVGVELRAGGRVTNGSAASTSALINGVDIEGTAGTVSNFGTISRVYFADTAGGGITNGSAASTSALISHGVFIYDAGGTVTNFGAISDVFNISGGTGVNFYNGTGTVTNSGTISGGFAGVIDSGAVTVTNFGTINGGVDGVQFSRAGKYEAGGSGAITNFGTISGGQRGVAINNAGVTVTNFGTISGSGGAAVAADVAVKVVVEPGAVFVGEVKGGGVSEIDFVAGGVADVSNVSGFATIGLSDGRHHTLTLTGANFAAVVGAAITVDDGDTVFDGFPASNTVTAATLPAKDRIIVHAGTGLDKLTGGGGNDVFYAGGDTMMTGKAGTNEFIFSAPGGNTVRDFAVSATNEIVFSNSGFSLGISGTPRALPTDLFVENSNGHFTNTAQRFAYATGSGDLFYSASAKSGTRTLVSHFTNAPALAASQLFFIT